MPRAATGGALPASAAAAGRGAEANAPVTSAGGGGEGDDADADAAESGDADGLSRMIASTALRFSEDARVHEVVRLLRSSRAVRLRVERTPEVSDHEWEQRKQARLTLLCKRVMALPVARGMFTLGTLRGGDSGGDGDGSADSADGRAHGAWLAEALAMPALRLAGRMPPTNITVSLDMREAASALLGGSTPAAQQTGTNQAATAAANASAGALALEWPSFHNGVAAGLRLTGANGIDAERGARDKAVGRSGLSLARGGITRTLSLIHI